MDIQAEMREALEAVQHAQTNFDNADPAYTYTAILALEAAESRLRAAIAHSKGA